MVDQEGFQKVNDKNRGARCNIFGDPGMSGTMQEVNKRGDVRAEVYMRPNILVGVGVSREIRFLPHKTSHPEANVGVCGCPCLDIQKQERKCGHCSQGGGSS